MASADEPYDVAIVGGGPAGCTCAIYTARSDLKTIIIDKNPAVGALAITHQIANYPGVASTTSGVKLLDDMRDQAVEFGAEYRRVQVYGVETEKEIKTVYTAEGEVKAKTLVLATGALGRTASFKGEDTYLGRGVSYCATCDGAFYRDREVAVVGINQEAVEEAAHLTKFAKTVHWITQTAGPKDDDVHGLNLLAKENVKHWSRTRLVEILGDDTGVTGVHLKVTKTKEETTIPLLGCFVYAEGSKPITDFIPVGALDLKEDGGVWVDERMATSVPGVYAIGDIRNTQFKQAVVAAADGCIAAMSLEQYLSGRKVVKLDWVHQ